jgi:hypothetical protein
MVDRANTSADEQADNNIQESEQRSRTWPLPEGDAQRTGEGSWPRAAVCKTAMGLGGAPERLGGTAVSSTAPVGAIRPVGMEARLRSLTAG